MRELRLFGTCFRIAWGRLCRQWPLLAGLALLCLLLPVGVGRAAEVLLSQGVAFEGVALAVTAPAGDQTPQQLAQYMGDMEDVAQFCQIAAMEEHEALEALKNGEVTAVLALPENFIQGVMWGTNPNLRLIVSGDRPLESLLLLWVGQSASDILSAFQSGVYAVLELYERATPPGLTRDQVVLDINLRYIGMALERETMFHSEVLSVTRVLPIALHYRLALLAYFALSAAPMFVCVYSDSWLRFQRRLRAVGRGAAPGYCGGVAASSLALFLLIAPALALGGQGPLLLRLGAAALMAVYSSVCCAVCCLSFRSAAGCGVAAFALSLAALALAGGIVPTVLLPSGLKALSWLSPVTWLMELAAWPGGYPVERSTWFCLALTGTGMVVLSLKLYRSQGDCQEVTL